MKCGHTLAVTSGSEVPKLSIAFLPVHSHFSSVRNHTRQKFALLTDDDLGSVTTLVLLESKRRHCNDSTDIETEKDIFIHNDARSNGGNNGAHNTNNCNNMTPTGITISQMPEGDDVPLYDSVASDEDLILTEQQTILAQQV